MAIRARSKKDPNYFTGTKVLVRWIEKQHTEGKKPRISSAAFERNFYKGKKEAFLSVNCQDLESLSEIIRLYWSKVDENDNTVFYIRQKISKLNNAANGVCADMVQYNRSEKCFTFLGNAAYTHEPVERVSYSHSGIHFLRGMNEIEEKAFSIAVVRGIKPEREMR